MAFRRWPPMKPTASQSLGNTWRRHGEFLPCSATVSWVMSAMCLLSGACVQSHEPQWVDLITNFIHFMIDGIHFLKTGTFNYCLNLQPINNIPEPEYVINLRLV